jgi:hypothetical protein
MMSDRDDLSDKLTREHTRNPKVQTSRNSIWQYATPSPFFPFRTITINRGDGHTDLLQNRRGPGFPPLTETWAHVSNPGPGPTFECAAFPAPLRQDCARTHCGKPIRLLSRRGAASRCRRPLALHPPPPYYYLTVPRGPPLQDLHVTSALPPPASLLIICSYIYRITIRYGCIRRELTRRYRSGQGAQHPSQFAFHRIGRML